jgi:hypothetical protein
MNPFAMGQRKQNSLSDDFVSTDGRLNRPISTHSYCV